MEQPDTMGQAPPRSEAICQAVHCALLPWFRRHRRRLPWRTRRRTAYQVWVSELMLQQTRVDTVADYYRRWMQRFPTLRSLAAADLHDVLKLWEGLGYYARARNAHRTAQYLVGERRGRFPRTLAGLNALPGVGPYTAAAIGSLAMGLPAAVVDGNVVRVTSRLYRLAEDPKLASARRRIEGWAADHVRDGPAGEINEAFMELGALICTPTKPACDGCPLRPVCRAAEQGDPEAFPIKSKAKSIPHLQVGAGVIVGRSSLILIARRPEHKMLGGLWEFPGGRREGSESMPACIARELEEELGIVVRVGPQLMVVRHAFSHFTMDLHAYWCRITAGRPSARECADFRWVDRDALKDYAMPKADQRIRERVQSMPPPPF